MLFLMTTERFQNVQHTTYQHRHKISAAGEEGNLRPCFPPCKYLSREKLKIPPVDKIPMDHKARKDPSDNAGHSSRRSSCAHYAA